MRTRDTTDGVVTAVSRLAAHRVSKQREETIRLIVGRGVEGDAHSGEKVQHRSRVARDPTQPNLRQVHLIHSELHDELRSEGFNLSPGEMGENITTRGVELLDLPTGARLHLGAEAVIEIAGLRNPCAQLDEIQPGLMAATVARDASGDLIRRAGIMSIVVVGGDVRPGDRVRVELPAQRQRPLVVV